MSFSLAKDGPAPPASPSQVGTTLLYSSTAPAAAEPPAAAPPSPAFTKGFRQCVKFVDHALRNSPRVNALLRKIEDKGCKLAFNPVVCEDVFEGAAAIGAYDAESKRIVMNPAVPERYLTQHQYTRGITHELIHAYDDCRVDMKQDNPKHMACTEIRAANLSGDCDFSDELKRTGFRFELGGVQQKCVRKRTLQSLKMHQACAGMTPAAIEGIIDEVWEPCYKDSSPFPTN
jgi:mitochondrial inner membrane protease ATP23